MAEDVAFGPIHMGLDSNEIQARVESAMSDVGLSGFGDRAPYHLSGGEKRRSAIATVLSMRPEIIVADEPSAGLDPRARRELIRLIESLPQTMLVATHDVDLARAVLPRCVIMNNGRVVADGPTGELTGRPGIPGILRIVGWAGPACEAAGNRCSCPQPSSDDRLNKSRRQIGRCS